MRRNSFSFAASVLGAVLLSAALVGCHSRDAGGSRGGSNGVIAGGSTTSYPATGAAPDAMMAGMGGRGDEMMRAAPPASTGEMAARSGPLVATEKVVTPQPPARVAQKTVLNPNMYVASTYQGGGGEKARVEKLIREGVLVDGKRVKLEAFSRNYAQAFPIPKRTALSLTATTERSKIVREGDRTYLQIGIQAVRGEAPRRPPLNLALVIDRSGSMGSEGKLEAAKAAAHAVVDRLGPGDYVSLTAFDNTAQILVPGGRPRPRSLHAAIDGIVSGSGTDIFAGLELGHREARKHVGPDRVSRVILLSDGEVTSGVSDQREFERLAAERSDDDVQTTAVGMGLEFNEGLMTAIAREGKGNYHFVQDAAHTRAVFARELDELTHVVAKAVRLRIRLAEGIGLVRVLGAQSLDATETARVRTDEKKIDRKAYEELGIRPDRQREPDEPGIKMVIPSFYRGDSHVVMLEIAVPRGSGTREIAEVSLKYKDLVARSNQQARDKVSIAYTPDRAEMIASVRPAVKKNLLGFQTGEALQQAASLLDEGRVADAVRTIDERMVVLGLAAREWRDRDLERDGRLLDRYKTVVASLGKGPMTANGELGQYLRKSMTYAGYDLTR